jgi:hypothetical protein
MRRKDFLSDYQIAFVFYIATDGCPLHLVNQNKGETKMTPNDIATSISGIVQTGDGNITASTNFTYSFGRLDDSNTWDR